MFGFFKKNDAECPVSEDTRVWLEEHVLWLTNIFGKEAIRNRKILVPESTDFPIEYDGKPQSAIETMKIVARQMEINPDDIHLEIYREGQGEIDAGNDFTTRIFMQNVEGEKYSGGLYFGKQEGGKYHIGLEEKKLSDPVQIVATLSHEFSHIKLLGENKLKKNNEELTDLTTIIFGLGIFNANVSFQIKTNHDSWGWSKSGYLSQMEWAYALALFAYIRGEKEPEWIQFLSRNIKSDFIKSEKFIRDNPDKIFKSKTTKPVTEGKDEALPKSEKSDSLINTNKTFKKPRKPTKSTSRSREYNTMGSALVKLKKYSEAIENYNKAIELDPDWDVPLNHRGYCELELGNLEKAYQDINKAREMNPDNSYAWMNLGLYYLKLNQFENALTYFEEARKIRPDTKLIALHLAKTYEIIGDTEKAEYYFMLDRFAKSDAKFKAYKRKWEGGSKNNKNKKKSR